MTFKLSPGVYTFEEDRSQVISDEAQNIVAQVGAFKRGSLKPTRVSTRADFLSKYTNGTVERSLGYSAYSAYNALENCRNLVIKRVVSSNAKYAGMSVIKAGVASTESVRFLNGTTTDYEQGGKEIKAIAISGPLPTGYGLSATMTNELSGESVEIVNAYSRTSSSNETLAAFAKLIQDQLDKWGENGKTEVNKVWSGAPKQQIQTFALSRAMIAGESISITVEDLYLGSKTVSVEFEESNEATLNALRLALNGTGYVFAYIDTTADNTLVITALAAGPKRIELTYEAVSVAEDELTAEIVQRQAGHGVYDDTTIAIQDPDSIPVEYSEVQVIALPIDDATIYSQVSAAAESGLILESDVSTVVTYVDEHKPVTSIDQLDELIATWAAENPYAKTLAIVLNDSKEVVSTPKENNVLTVDVVLSDNSHASSDELAVEWTDESGEQTLGSSSTLTLTSEMIGLKIKATVVGYRNTLTSITQNAVEAE